MYQAWLMGVCFSLWRGELDRETLEDQLAAHSDLRLLACEAGPVAQALPCVRPCCNVSGLLRCSLPLPILFSELCPVLL